MSFKAMIAAAAASCILIIGLKLGSISWAQPASSDCISSHGQSSTAHNRSTASCRSTQPRVRARVKLKKYVPPPGKFLLCQIARNADCGPD